MTSDHAIPATGVLRNQMEKLGKEHLKTHTDVVAVLPTQKMDKDPHRWNVICEKDKFKEAKQCVMENNC